ncbi:MAG: Ppx/GppA family phosphatase [Actinobacteria bacterium]|nr:MAG: Ppx/GppA family phosphatase [Actinomycetota bacterium]
MRIGVVDIGTNSTRLLVCDVGPAGVTDIERRSEVTRLGEQLEANGSLAERAVERVFAVLADYRQAIERHACQQAVAVLTSAARDAANGPWFTAEIERRFGLCARIISGDEEAQLTYLGAMSERSAAAGPAAVFDIGGGSTEVIVGRGRQPAFHVSMPIGVVRLTERHIHSDPPPPDEVRRLADDARGAVARLVPGSVREQVITAVAVAGTATSAAAMDLELEPYDHDRVHGHRLERGAVELLLARMAAIPEAQRRQVPGLHPDRAPTIVAGLAILLELLGACGLESVEVSEHDILRGAALIAAGEQAPT